MIGSRKVNVEVTVEATVEEAWQAFTRPEAIMKWNFASEDWTCPSAKSELKEGGLFTYRMESKDGKYGFDFWGKFERIEKNSLLEYELGDGRQVLISFRDEGGKTKVEEQFEIEEENPADRQKNGWQAILDNYKKYVEENGNPC